MPYPLPLPRENYTPFVADFAMKGVFIMKTKQLTINALLAAMCAVLGYLALDTNIVKASFESLPVLVSALLFGPVNGMLVGGIGSLVYQLLRYGVSATTALWMLPCIASGLIAGLGARIGKFSLSRTQTIVLIVVSELVFMALNTFAILVDSKLYGYYFPGIITGALGVRLIICVVKAAAYGAILPVLIKPLRQLAGSRAQ